MTNSWSIHTVNEIEGTAKLQTVQKARWVSNAGPALQP